MLSINRPSKINRIEIWQRAHFEFAAKLNFARQLRMKLITIKCHKKKFDNLHPYQKLNVILMKNG